MIRRRRPSTGPFPSKSPGAVIPFLVMLVMFAWGTKLYFQNYTPPVHDTLDIYVTGKQWMWKVQYPTGQREINELHVPIGRAVKLILASEDVIHSFYIPAFRLKHDVVPGSYQTYWFEATRARPLSHFLRGILRHQPFGHGRLGDRDDAE